MATGAEHYAEAERLLELEQSISAKDIPLRQLLVDKAVAHALLAQAANSAPVATSDSLFNKWMRVLR
jgi:hypothetical protein